MGKIKNPLIEFFGLFTGLGKNVIAIAETSVRYINKAIQNRVKDLVFVIVYLVLGLFFLLAAFTVFLFTAYQAISRYINHDPLVASGILGGILLVTGLVFLVFLSRRLKD